MNGMMGKKCKLIQVITMPYVKLPLSRRDNYYMLILQM